MRRVSLTLVVMALLFAGCGDDSNAAGNGENTTTTKAGAVLTGPSGEPLSEFCVLAKQYQAELLTSLFTLLLPSADLEQSKKTVESTRAAVGALRDSAPPELAEATKIVATEISGLLDAFVAAGYDAKKLDPNAMKFEDSPGFANGLKAIVTYAEKDCGVTVPTKVTTTTAA